MTKKIKRTAEQRITRARSALVIFQPFYGTLLMNLDIQETKQFPTMATNGVTCLWNREFVDSQSDEEVLFTLCHEAEHVALQDHTRRRNRDPMLWNIAGDYRINANLINAKIGKMPKGGLFDPRFADGSLSIEDIYAILEQEQQSQQPQPGQPGQPGQGDGDEDGDGASGEAEEGDDGQPGQAPGKGGEDDPEAVDGKPGSGDGDEADESDAGDGEGGEGDGDGEDGEGEGEGDGEGEGEGDGQPGQGQPGQGGGKPKPSTCGDPGGCGEVLDAPGDAAEVAAQAAHWETITRQAIHVAAKHAGSLPGHIERLASELGKPQQNWREILRRFVDQSATFDYSFKQPDRRFGHTDYILPGQVSDGTHHVLIAVDTSGSINDTALSRFRTEAQALLDEGAVDKITVIDCDAKVNTVAEFESGDLIKMVNNGGGGTSFKPVWEWLDKNPNDAAAVVYFTDLEPCDGFGNEPALPVLWAAYANSYSGPAELRQRMKTVPFGECIEIRD